jgi:hypothetical protein
MNFNQAFIKFTTHLMLAFACSSFAQEIKLGTNSLISFASLETAKQILTNRDEFIRALSPFDRAARMKTDREVTEEEFLKFVANNVLPWRADETNQIAAVLRALEPRLAPWNLPFPSTLWLIKTSGNEEGNASYTRQNAVIVAQKEVRLSERGLEDLLIHELFHVLSRNHQDLQKRLYRVVGFIPIHEIAYPAGLRSRKITNPDGVQSGWAIQITNQNHELSAVPILFASTAQYDPQKGGEFFNYLQFKLLVVTNHNDTWQPQLLENQPCLLEPREAHGFFEQVGQNTDYIIHPDEILAVNFVHLINGKTNLPTPRIVEEMKKAFLSR